VFMVWRERLFHSLAAGKRVPSLRGERGSLVSFIRPRPGRPVRSARRPSRLITATLNVSGLAVSRTTVYARVCKPPHLS
jgi:hypothetical protein